MWNFVAVAQGTNVTGDAIVTSKITKTGASGAFDAGASTVETLDGDGFIEFTVPDTTKDRALGFGYDDANLNYTDIDYAWYLTGGGQVYVRYNGAIVFGPVAYAANDVFRVERVGSTVRFYQNGELRHTSATASVGALRVDSSLYTNGGVFDGVRLYDASSSEWRALTWQNVTASTVGLGAVHYDRRVDVVAPTGIRPGDILVAVVASQGYDFARPEGEWIESAARTSTLGRAIRVLHRIATSDEPSRYSFRLAARHEAVGALLVYRGGDDGLMLGLAGADHPATVTGVTPSVAKQRATDLFVGAAVLHHPQGQTVSALSAGAKRVEFQQQVFVSPLRLALFDLRAATVGSTNSTVTITGLPAGASFSTFAFAIPGRPLQSRSHSPIATGAIGLPTEGI